MREISKLGAEDLRRVFSAFVEGAWTLLEEFLAELREGFEKMEELSREQAEGSRSKFKTFTMSCGSVDEFHRGMQDRTGCPLPTPAEPLASDPVVSRHDAGPPEVVIARSLVAPSPRGFEPPPHPLCQLCAS